MWHMKHMKVSSSEKKNSSHQVKKKRFPPYMYKKKNDAKSFSIRRPLAANGRQAGSKINSAQLPPQISTLRFSFDDGTRRGISTRWAVLRWTPFRRVRFCVCWWAFSWANLLYLPYCYEAGAPNENIVQNYLNIAFLNVFWVDIGIFSSPKNFSSVRIS